MHIYLQLLYLSHEFILYHYIMFLSLIRIFVLKYFFSEVSIAVLPFFWFPIYMEYRFLSSTFIYVCFYTWSESLVGSMCMYLIFVASDPLYVFSLEHLFHLHLKLSLMGMCLLLFKKLFWSCFHSFFFVSSSFPSVITWWLHLMLWLNLCVCVCMYLL